MAEVVMSGSIAIIGYGKVGEALVEILIENDQPLKYICTKRKNNINGVQFVNSVDAILNDESVNIYMLAIPGVEEPFEIIKKCLQKKKNIISCGKEVWSRKTDEIVKISKENNTPVYASSLVASNRKETHILITSSNILDFNRETLYTYKGAGAKETAKVMYKDLVYIQNNDL